MVLLLDEHWRDYYIFSKVDQFYYMEMYEEITFLEMKVKSGNVGLMRALEERKFQAFVQWKHDFQWLNRYLNSLSGFVKN